MQLIAMGSAALVEGFALLGFATHPDATAEDVDEVLTGLLRGDDKALLFLESGLAGAGSRVLAQVRREGGRIIVTEIPPLQSPDEYRPPVENLVLRVLGASALEERA